MENHRKTQQFNIKLNNSLYTSVTNPETISNAFNDYFISMGKNKNSGDSTRSSCFNYNSFKKNNETSFYIRKVTNEEIINIAHNMKGDSALGKDGISIKLVKKTINYIVDILVNIFNQIINDGIFPESFKTAIITPIHKSGSSDNINNYRPISLLNTFSKMFEKAIKNRLLIYLEENNLLPNNQFGFRKNLGTEDALAHLTKQLYTNLDKNQKIIGVFMDLSKAFDSISHSKLLSILSSIGLLVGTSFSYFNPILANVLSKLKLTTAIVKKKQLQTEFHKVQFSHQYYILFMFLF